MIKKVILLILAAAVLRGTGLLPFQSSDVAQLVPVQALVVRTQGDRVILDAGPCRGIGPDWESAWQDLQRSAQGHVFLGTADHVVLCADAVHLLPRIVENETLRPAASICVCPEYAPSAGEAAAYLASHDPGVTLQQVRALRLRAGTVRLPRLIRTEGGLRLVGTRDR